MERKLETSRRKESCLLIFSGLALFLDVPSARAYNEHEAWTEELGRFFFHGFKELLGLPLPTTAFEISSYLFLLVMLLFWGLQTSRIWRALTVCALLIPVAALISFLFGLLQGHSAGLGSTQIHYLPFVGLWLVLGYFMGVRPQLMQAFFRLLFAVALWKAVYGLYVFAFAYDFQMGAREFLIDHPSSILLAAGMLYAGYRIWITRDPRVKFAYALAVLPLAWAYVLNDRRTSFAGVLVFAVLLPWIVPIGLRNRLMPYYRFGILLSVAGACLIGLAQIDPNSFLGGFSTEFAAAEELTYRHMENFNLLTAVVKSPWTGLGFGTTYPQEMRLPDISAAFTLFEAIPHNTVYFLWAFTGPLGIACFASLISVSLVVVIRCGRWARSKGVLLHAMFGLLILSQWVMYSFYDMGLIEARSSMLFGIVIGSLFPQYARRLKEHYHAQLTSAHSYELPSALPMRPFVSRR